MIARLPELDVFECGRCRHQFSANIRDTKEYGREYFETEHANWFLHPDTALFARIRDQILAYVPAGRRARVIDIGCGPGAFLDFLHAEGFGDLHGLDLYAAESGRFRRIVGEFEATPLQETFDVIVSMMNIEHVADPNRYVDAMSDILSPGGVVIINTIDSHALIYRLAWVAHSMGVSFPTRRLYEKHHLNHFNRSSLDTLMTRHGYVCRAAFTKNYPLDATDWPKGRGAWAVRAAVAAINVVSDLTGGRISQTKVYARRADV